MWTLGRLGGMSKGVTTGNVGVGCGDESISLSVLAGGWEAWWAGRSCGGGTGGLLGARAVTGRATEYK